MAGRRGGAGGGPAGVLNAAGLVPRETGWEFTGTEGPAGAAAPPPAGRYGLTAARRLPPPRDLSSPGGRRRGSARGQAGEGDRPTSGDSASRMM